jgi:hypothetical protein
MKQKSTHLTQQHTKALVPSRFHVRRSNLQEEMHGEVLYGAISIPSR